MMRHLRSSILPARAYRRCAVSIRSRRRPFSIESYAMELGQNALGCVHQIEAAYLAATESPALPNPLTLSDSGAGKAADNIAVPDLSTIIDCVKGHVERLKQIASVPKSPVRRKQQFALGKARMPPDVIQSFNGPFRFLRTILPAGNSHQIICSHLKQILLPVGSPISSCLSRQPMEVP